MQIPGRHNLENALAAAAAALLAGIEPQTIANALSTFPGVSHRLEPAGVVGGVKYVNDSKGTNPESVLKALDSFQEPIILIAGGKPKGSDFNILAGRIRARVKALVLLGQAAPQIEQAVRATGYTAIWNEDSLEGCVRTAARLAAPGDLVLLSPACASWDMFSDYEERGDLFKKLVQELDT
jgi:UDP-N-acetylmuramoylalanine--D-glutamate ligase